MTTVKQLAKELEEMKARFATFAATKEQNTVKCNDWPELKKTFTRRKSTIITAKDLRSL